MTARCPCNFTLGFAQLEQHHNILIDFFLVMVMQQQAGQSRTESRTVSLLSWSAYDHVISPVWIWSSQVTLVMHSLRQL